MSVQRLSFTFGLVLTVASLTAHARADVPPLPIAAHCTELPCSVNRNCSSTGVACMPDDRACTEEARSKDLEVKCEQECDVGKRLVYCPPDTGRGESGVVWLLLSVAVLLAVGGGGLFWLVLRKKSA